MSEIEIKGQTYSVGRLDALRQFHLTRRIAPLAISGGLSLADLRRGAVINPDDLMASMAPMASVLAAMSDEDVEYVLATCLSVVKRRQEFSGQASWSPAAHGAQPMFDDIDMAVMLRLAVAVLQENLAGFMRGLDDTAPSDSSSAQPGPQARAQGSTR